MAIVPAQVLLATWNGERYVEEQVRSILGQEHRDLRLLVRDDGSTDRTVEILHRLAVEDDRIVVLPPDGERLGPGRSFLRLLAAAPAGASAYLFCDQDDRWLPHKVGRAVSSLQGRARPTLYACRTRRCDPELRDGFDVAGPRRIALGNALVQNHLPGCATAIDDAARALVLRWGACDMNGLDHWVFLLLTTFGDVVVDDEVGIWHRRHPGTHMVATRPLWRSLRRRLERVVAEGTGTPFVRQARPLLDGPDPLTPAQRSLVEWFVRPRPTVRSRIGLTCSRRVWREPWSEDLVLRVRLLLAGA